LKNFSFIWSRYLFDSYFTYLFCYWSASVSSRWKRNGDDSLSPRKLHTGVHRERAGVDEKHGADQKVGGKDGSGARCVESVEEWMEL
jgi:hypothetical protein